LFCCYLPRLYNPKKESSMKKKKGALIRAAQLLGFKINEDAIEELPAEEILEADDLELEGEPGDEFEEEPAPASVQSNIRRPASPRPQAIPENLMQLNQLITEVGGMDAYKSLLLNAVEAVEAMQNNQQAERDAIVAHLVANSAGGVTEEELKKLDLPALQIMQRAMAIPMPNMNYGPLGPRTKLNVKAEDVAQPPSFFLNTEEKK
jgi:hypothetical protein